MNRLRLVKKFAKLKNINNLTILDKSLVALSTILFFVSIISIVAGRKFADSRTTWIEGYGPDIFSYIDDIFFFHQLTYGVLGLVASLILIHIALKK